MLSVVAVPITAGAADREHEQLMAEIRMLSENVLRLNMTLIGFDQRLETLAAGQTELEDAMRRAFADQDLVAENTAATARVLREKLDEANVRLSSISQEIEALRAAIPPLPPPATQLLVDPETGLPIEAPPAAGGAAPEAAGAPVPAPVPIGAPAAGFSPQRMFDLAMGDYMGGSGSWPSRDSRRTCRGTRSRRGPTKRCSTSENPTTPTAGSRTRSRHTSRSC